MSRFPSTWSDEHRLAISLLAAVSVVMLAFAFLSIGKSITRPFETDGGRFVSLDQKEAEAKAALKFKDTDADELTDYDELYIYHTSPYLSDTDSDGIADGVEVKKGTDPNCPEGKQCSSGATAAPPANVNPNDALMGAPTLVDPNSLAGLATGQSSGADTSVLTAFDAVKVRAVLKNAGMSDAQLAKISDTQLKQIYDETMADEVSSSTLNKMDQAATKANQ